MRIKEVEQRTGLTAKAIRLYESKGLLKPARETENDYRDYTEEDVSRLKNIAILRKLDLSVAEIKEWTDGQSGLYDLLHRVSARGMLETEKADDRVKLSVELLEILEEDPDKPLDEAVAEAEELRKLMAELDAAQESLRGNLMWPVWTTLMAMGPVGWTFFHIFLGETKDALISLAVSLLVLPFVCWKWFKYFQVDKSMRKKSGCLPALIFGVCGLLGAFGSLILVMLLQQYLFGPETGYYLFRPGWMIVTVGYPLLVIWFIVELLTPSEVHEMTEDDEEEQEPEEVTRLEKLKAVGILVAFHLVLLYGCLTGASFYSEGQFIRHSFFNPVGKVYELSDIEKVEAGFYGWVWAPWKEKGDFYYEITFTDGRTENWAQINGSDEGDSDPWEDLLELDQILMDAGVEKVSDWDHRENFPYDNSCLEICDQILNNQ